MKPTPLALSHSRSRSRSRSCPPPASRTAGMMLCGLLLTLNPLAAQTARVWTGASGDGLFTTDLNWDPAGFLLPEDELTISSGEAINTGNLNLGGLVTVSGTGNLTVTNGRFLNGSGLPSQVRVNGGFLVHDGQYFIASMNNPGEIIQSGGSVTSAVSVAWFLSDGANAKGTYELTGGTLDVTLSGDSALDRQIPTWASRATATCCILTAAPPPSPPPPPTAASISRGRARCGSTPDR
ncbi:MAG: hypothetical protein EOP86_18110 [Verrucomicrobiaceae bacterium]|nr:MAG: hypothetical protein EOP86_18110 [Verrucomicrobiaceae bacterium]